MSQKGKESLVESAVQLCLLWCALVLCPRAQQTRRDLPPNDEQLATREVVTWLFLAPTNSHLQVEVLVSSDPFHIVSRCFWEATPCSTKAGQPATGCLLWKLSWPRQNPAPLIPSRSTSSLWDTPQNALVTKYPQTRHRISNHALPNDRILLFDLKYVNTSKNILKHLMLIPENIFQMTGSCYAPSAQAKCKPHCKPCRDTLQRSTKHPKSRSDQVCAKSTSGSSQIDKASLQADLFVKVFSLSWGFRMISVKIRQDASNGLRLFSILLCFGIILVLALSNESTW